MSIDLTLDEIDVLLTSLSFSKDRVRNSPDRGHDTLMVLTSVERKLQMVRMQEASES